MRRFSLASLNPLRAIGHWAAHYQSEMLHDVLRSLGSKMHSTAAETQGQLRGFEERQVARDGMILSEIAEFRKEQADFRAAHHFVGDPKAPSPSVTTTADRMVPRHSSARDPRLPAGRPHP